MTRIGAVLLAVCLLPLSGCSLPGLLSQAVDRADSYFAGREQRQERGWEVEDYITCDEAAEIRVDAMAGRWCSRVLAPTMADCLAGYGERYHFGDRLSGASEKILHNLCTAAEVGQLWPHLDGLRTEGRLMVLDANRGAQEPKS